VAPLAVLGSAWLLMSQVRIVQTRTIGAGAIGDSGQAAAGEVAAAVSLIELRRATQGGRDGDGEAGQRRRSDKRWWGNGHWRQQVCGPKHALRKPIWISPYIKGDADAEVSERVNVWRR